MLFHCGQLIFHSDTRKSSSIAFPRYLRFSLDSLLVEESKGRERWCQLIFHFGGHESSFIAFLHAFSTIFVEKGRERWTLFNPLLHEFLLTN